jgi:predicted DNA-binding transcriptional regulator YafY
MMKLIAQLQNLDRLDGLIRRKATGSSVQLAGRLGCSRRTIYNYLKTLEELGAEVVYCDKRRSYYYETALPVDLHGLLYPGETGPGE